MTAVLQHPATVPAHDAETTEAKHPARFGKLTAKDRCEAPVSPILFKATGNRACGAQAFVRVVVTEEQHLLFCVHDYRKHAPYIASKAFEVIDESATINAKPTDPSQSQGF